MNTTKPKRARLAAIALAVIMAAVTLAAISGNLLRQPAPSLLPESNQPQVQPPEVAILPDPAEWKDYGMVVDATPFGEGWDVLFEGYTPATLLKKDDTYFLYYVGADGYISQKDNIGPAHRSIGVATSTDGVNWTKYPGNPVITFASSGNPEEGAVSAGVIADSTGTFYAYYGSNIAATPTSTDVNADVRLATSPDGFSFTDQGPALSHSDRVVWGSGDELHPIVAWEQDGAWYTFYLPNGTSEGGKLGLASGVGPLDLTSSAAVLSGRSEVNARGAGSIVPLSKDTLALFLNYRGALDVRTASVEDLRQLSAPVRSYGQETGNRIVYLDGARRTWFMIYDRWSHMGLRLAPAGPLDTTPPSAPPALAATAVSHDAVDLAWEPATDPDTGVVEYEVLRDRTKIASTKERTYADRSGLAELAEYAYEVRAVNYHGTEGPGSSVAVTTLADSSPPEVQSVEALGPTQLWIAFSEPVERTSAETVSNYAVTGGVRVLAATVDGDARSVTLETTAQSPNWTYSLRAAKVLDLAQAPNASNSEAPYVYDSIPGLVAYWPLDDESSSRATDSSGHRGHGEIRGGPSWTAGRSRAAIDLDGVDDYVEVDGTPVLNEALSGSFSVSIWAQPSGVPPGTTNSDGAYAMITGPNVALQYGLQQDVMAQTSTTEGEARISAGPVSPGIWHHVVMVVDATEKSLRLYLDGQQASGSPVSFPGEIKPLPPPVAGVMDEHFSHFRLGVKSPLFDLEKNYFRGAIDEVRIYGRALDEAEVERLYMLSSQTAP